MSKEVAAVGAFLRFMSKRGWRMLKSMIEGRNGSSIAKRGKTLALVVVQRMEHFCEVWK